MKMTRPASIALIAAFGLTGCASTNLDRPSGRHSDRTIAGNMASVDYVTCGQIMTPGELQGSYQDLLKKNTDTVDNVRIWSKSSHVIVRYFNGDRTKPVLMVLDGVNKIYPSEKPDDILGKPVPGYTAYNLQTDEGEVDEWGATLFIDEANLWGPHAHENGARMIYREGAEDSDPIDTPYWCEYIGGGIDDHSTYP